MKRSTQFLIAISAIVALCTCTIIACNKEAKEKDAKLTVDKLAADVSILAADSSCLTNTGSISSTGSPSTYSSWTTTSVTLGSGTSAVTVQFEGTLGTFVRATSANTYIGTILEDSTCAAWSSMYTNVQVKNNAFNLGTAPSSPCNVVGVIGTVGADNFKGGYYTYDPATRTYDVTRAIVIYKTSATGDCTVSTPALTTGTVYILWVSTIITNTTGTAGTVKYRWYKRV